MSNVETESRTVTEHRFIVPCEEPWEADSSEENNYSIKSPGTEWGDGYAWVSDPDNAAFIAAARNAIPELIEENAALREKVEAGIEHRRYLVGRLKGTNHRADNQEARAVQAEADRNSNAVALAQAVIRADKADAKVRAVRDALEEPEVMVGRELYISVDRIRRALDGE